jgi:hypothetical protein
MNRLLRWHVMSETAGRRVAWVGAFFILATCTTLVLKMLSEFDLWTSLGLVFAVAVGWLVLGWESPRLIKREASSR